MWLTTSLRIIVFYSAAIFPLFCFGGTPWITLVNPRTHTTLTVIGSTHSKVGLSVSVDVVNKLDDILKHTDLAYFEAVDGVFSPRRKTLYENAQSNFVRYADLSGIAKVCALGAIRVLPEINQLVLYSAPIVLSVSLFQNASSETEVNSQGFVKLGLSDASIFQLAVKAGIPIREAETTNDIIKYASQYTLGQVDEAITSTCKAMGRKDFALQKNKANTELLKLISDNNWDAVASRYGEFQTNIFKMPIYIYEEFINGRNNAMASRVVDNQTINNKNVVLIVGAAHLGGPNGLIQKFVERGFELKRE
jgi:TraB/PrgY/gumN family